MRYLNSNDYGFDPHSLGFPSVKSCQAIVLLTSNGLYGLHDLKAGSVRQDQLKIQCFGDWAKKRFRENSLTKIKLYGVINNVEQYSNKNEKGGNGDWDAALMQVANALEFDGPIRKYRVYKHIDKPKQKGSSSGFAIYIQLDVSQGDESCIIRYKRMSKLKANDGQGFKSKTYGFIGSDGNGFKKNAPNIKTISLSRIGKSDTKTQSADDEVSKREVFLHTVAAKEIMTVRL